MRKKTKKNNRTNKTGVIEIPEKFLVSSELPSSSAVDRGANQTPPLEVATEAALDPWSSLFLYEAKDHSGIGEPQL